MKRTHYRNGDEITLACGCDSCSPSTIQGTLCHEPGCKDSWRDYKAECDECGCDFWPEDKGQATCESCRNPEQYIRQCEECGDEARHSDPDQEVCDSCLFDYNADWPNLDDLAEQYPD